MLLIDHSVGSELFVKLALGAGRYVYTVRFRASTDATMLRFPRHASRHLHSL